MHDNTFHHHESSFVLRHTDIQKAFQKLRTELNYQCEHIM